jgi:glycosyltransferase involved in cell wall biosynthesis
MKIIFYENTLNLRYNPNTAKNVGIGSLASCMIELAREFAKKGHDVTCYIKCNTPDLYDGVKYYDITNYNNDFCDLFIGLESFPRQVNAKFIINWVQKNVLDVNFKSGFHKIVLASDWQKTRFSQQFPGLTEKMEVIENGIDLNLFNRQKIKKIDNTIIHTAFPTKGMIYLNDIYTRIYEEFPEVKLHIHTGGQLWGWDNEQFRKMYNKMIKNKILFHGNIGRKKLAKRLNQSKIFLHPCVFEEHFGQTILEAMTSGCVVITTPIGNIPNLIKNNKTGYLIEGSPSDFVWQHKAKDKVIELLKDNNKFQQISNSAREFSLQFDWSKIIDKWLKLI